VAAAVVEGSADSAAVAASAAAAPEETSSVIEPFLSLADRVLGTGYSAVVSGSIVRGDHIPGKSDHNLLLVAERLGPAELKGLGPEFARFAREHLGPPLLVTRAEWVRAADVFPIEIADIRTAYRVVRGSDPLAGQTVRREELRRALETEFRGKLLRLRVGYGLHSDDPAGLAAVIGQSIGPVRVLLRATLVLLEHDVRGGDRELVDQVARRLGVEQAPLLELLAHRRDTAWKAEPALFQSYLGIVESATRFIDQYHAGDH
jgi:hypothetical protein